MPATPSSLRRPKLATVQLDFGEGDIVAFTFDRNKITDAWMEEWARAEEERDTGFMNEALADLIVRWDIKGDDGSAYDPSAEHIGHLFTVADKASILREMMMATVPTEVEKRGSSTPSATPPSNSLRPPQDSPNGSTTSPSPTPSTAPSST
jgi:hypothetical protein